MKLKQNKWFSQHSLHRIMQAVSEAWNSKKFEEAIELLESAGRREPSNIDILLELGRLYGLLYDSAAAERCYEKAARLTNSHGRALATAGLQCRDAGNFAMAGSYFMRSIERSNAFPELYVELAKVYERLRKLDDAADTLARALQLNPDCPEALLTRARLERQAGRLETAEQTIRSAISVPTPDAWIQAQTWYELERDSRSPREDMTRPWTPACRPKPCCNRASAQSVTDLQICPQEVHRYAGQPDRRNPAPMV